MREQLVTHADRIYDGTNPCTSITVHETANQSVGANARAHANLQTSGGARQASWHIQVDDTEAIRSYPDTAQCWHAGTDDGNRTSIAIEICVNADGDYDEAFKRAAGVVAGLRAKHNLSPADVHQHNHWSGKNCPTQMRVTDRWQEFLNLTDTQGATPVTTMCSPFEGRLTQNHADGGGYAGHKGMDIAPPKPGQTRMPVYAAFAGTVERVFRTAKPGNRNSTWAPGRTGDGMLVRNPDGEGNGYNHMYPLAGLKAGSKVSAGQLIGHNNLTGNMSGAHLHFELWADYRDPNSDYDPQLAFRKFGVKPGSAPGLVVVPVASVKPRPTAKPKPTSKPKPSSSGNSKSDNIAIQKALTKMGINVGFPDGDDGPMMKRGVKEFQRAHGLVADGNWGSKTQAVFDLNKRIQSALKKQGYTAQTVDGFLGAQSEANIKDFQRRTGLTRDGKAGPVTQKRLGI